MKDMTSNSVRAMSLIQSAEDISEIERFITQLNVKVQVAKKKIAEQETEEKQTEKPSDQQSVDNDHKSAGVVAISPRVEPPLRETMPNTPSVCHSDFSTHDDNETAFEKVVAKNPKTLLMIFTAFSGKARPKMTFTRTWDKKKGQMWSASVHFGSIVRRIALQPQPMGAAVDFFGDAKLGHEPVFIGVAAVQRPGQFHR